MTLDGSGLAFHGAMLTDIRFALRTLLNNRGFTAVALVTLGIGIGANTAIFSVVNGVLLRPLPYPHAERIVEIWSTKPGSLKGNHAAGDFMDLRRGSRSFAALAGYREEEVTVAKAGAEPVRLTGVVVSAEYFDVFGMRAVHGRTFSGSADAKTNDPRVVLGESTWRLQFGADPNVVGQPVRVNGVSHTVVGVVPQAFAYPAAARVWVLSPLPVPPSPLEQGGDPVESRDVRYFNAVARLANGVTLAQATADVARVAADIASRFPATGTGRGILLEPLHERIVGDVRGALLVLLAAVGVVLLIACANVSSLLLARASGRQRELAIRSALGAGRSRIIRQLITESLLLAIGGGVAGLVLGAWVIDLLVSVLPEGTPRVEQIGLDRTVAAAAILTSCASALLFGLVPALQASRSNAALALRADGRTSTADRQRARTRTALVVAEVALTLVLLVSAGLLANSFLRLRQIDPGFSADHVVMMPLPLPQAKYGDGEQQWMLYQRVLEEIRQRPGVESAAILFPRPLQGRNANSGFSIEGWPDPASPGDRPRASIGSISPGYFRTMGIPIVRGRDFTEQDREPAPAVAIVNATLANHYWAREDPIGKRLRFGRGDDWMTVVAVAGDSRDVGLHESPGPKVYLPYHNFPLPFMSVAVRSAAGTDRIATALREALQVADPDLPAGRLVPLREIVADSIAEPRFRTILLAAFAFMATLLSAVGVYGLMSYSVTQRTRELGIRMALGASRRQVLLPILREGVVLGVAGVGLGLLGAMAATRLLEAFLFGVGALDPITFAGVSLLLLAVASAASYVPSRRALNVNPTVALRGD